MLEFPEGEGRFFINGVCGPLQTSTMAPSNAPGVGEPGVVAVVCHPHPLMGGTMNNKVVHTIARCHRDLGHRVVRFNFRGVEKSEGTYAEGIGEVDDLMAVLHWLTSVRPRDSIVLAGFSFGSYVASRALQLSLRGGIPVVSLLLVAPAVVNYDFENFTAFGVPLRVIVGDSDEVVDPASIYRWFDSVTTEKKKVVLEGAGHFFHGQLTELKGLVEQLANIDKQENLR
ncbi:MAG: alpha/beta hydrolase [Pseudomonadales bacterium]|nr:alpha/beta hydrolase [Pseudomonadales bacterium]